MYTTIIFNATVYNYYSSYITLFCQMSERTYSHPAVELSDHTYHSNRKKIFNYWKTTKKQSRIVKFMTLRKTLYSWNILVFKI